MTLLTFSLLISEDLWLFLEFPAVGMFSAHLSEVKRNTANAEKTKKEENPEILTTHLLN